MAFLIERLEDREIILNKLQKQEQKTVNYKVKKQSSFFYIDFIFFLE